MGWLRGLWIEIAFVALLQTVAGALLGLLPRWGSEAAGFAVFFFSQAAVLAALAFLVLRSTLIGWWLAAAALLAMAGAQLVAQGVEGLVLGESPAALVSRLARHGVLAAAGVPAVVWLASGWARSRLPITVRQLVSLLPPTFQGAAVYALAWAGIGWGLGAVGAGLEGAEAAPLGLLLAAGFGRGVAMLAGSAPLLLTLVGRRVKNGVGLGALLGLAAGAAPELMNAKVLTAGLAADAMAQAALGFLLGAAFVRLTRPPLVQRESTGAHPVSEEQPLEPVQSGEG